MIEVFKTNISRKRAATNVLKELESIFPNDKISLDLEDCDKILRVENNNNVDVASYLQGYKGNGLCY